jgi:hypothetical protein
MPLASGARLGPYEIFAPLGAGGLGEVYRRQGHAARAHGRDQSLAGSHAKLALEACPTPFVKRARPRCASAPPRRPLSHRDRSKPDLQPSGEGRRFGSGTGCQPHRRPRSISWSIAKRPADEAGVRRHPVLGGGAASQRPTFWTGAAGEGPIRGSTARYHGRGADRVPGVCLWRRRRGAPHGSRGGTGDTPVRRALVVPQSHESFLAGLHLFQRRPDKGYSLVDCISMNAMRSRSIREVLTDDRHFAQEGFTPLL